MPIMRSVRSGLEKKDIIHWDIEDPAAFKGNDEEKLNEFQRIFDIIKEKIEKEFLTS